MIQLFRKIRRRMLQENRFTKYLLYAIGEIVLVVIGILIALQVNTWNKLRIDRQSEREVLVDLNSEIKTNIQDLEMIIDEHEKSLNAGNQLKPFIIDTTKLSGFSNDSLNNLIKLMNYNWTYDPKLGILNSVINSGKINLIKNKEIRYKLSSISDFIKDANESTDEIGKLRSEFYWPTVDAKRNVYNHQELSFESKPLFVNPQFIWWVKVATVIREEGLDEEIELLNFMKDLSGLIDSEIDG